MNVYIFNGLLWPIFLLILITHLYSRKVEIANKKDNSLQIISKSLLMSTLILIFIINVYVLSSPSQNSQYLPLVICGLVFGWIGDLFLISWKNKNSFILTIAGLFSFLLQHILIMIYLGLQLETQLIDSRWFWLILIPFILMPFVIWQVRLIKNTNSLFKVIICIYATSLIIMLGLSIVTIVATGYKIWLPIFLGSILFAISDSILGLKLFRGLKIKTIYVMSTYGLAQALLTIGFIVMATTL